MIYTKYMLGLALVTGPERPAFVLSYSPKYPTRKTKKSSEQTKSRHSVYCSKY
jgi:hypothetical protein